MTNTWLVWSLSLILAMFKVALELKGTQAFPLVFAVLWFAFFLLIAMTWGGITGFENFVLNAYFWLLVGIVFKLPALIDQSRSEGLGLRHPNYEVG